MLKKILLFILIGLTLSCGSSKFDVNHGVTIEPISDDIKSKLKVITLEKSTGVIFPKEYEIGFNKGRLVNRFTPSEKEIQEAEIEVKKQYLDSDKRSAYNQTFVKFADNYEGDLEQQQKNYQNNMKWNIKEAKKSIKFDRQYIGFWENGEKILLIQFLDFSDDPYNLKDQITNSFIGGWHGWFETNVRLKEYNMNKKRLNSFGLPDL